MRYFLTAALASLMLSGTTYAQSGMSGPDRQADPIRVKEIENMPENSWLHYGRPWSDVDPGRASTCGRKFTAVLGAWNGVLWDGRYVWSWAAGGHGDGCFNGILRYDLVSGKPEMVVPHLPLNVPLCRPFVKANGSQDCYWEPYASDSPYPGSMSERIPAWEGSFLRPRSSHMYNNLVRIDDWVYLLTGQIFGSSKVDSQVWRFNATADDIASTIERLPDRIKPGAGAKGDRGGQSQNQLIGGIAVNWVKRPGKPPLMFSGATACEPDLVKGQFNCVQHPSVHFSSSATMAWDEGRQGIWAIDPNLSRLMFMRESNGQWFFDETLSTTDAALINKGTIGSGGLCLVPTAKGINPVIWGKSESLVRWDGQSLQTIELPGGPGEAPRRVFNKWTWNEDLGVCLGTWTVDEGFWVYKPDFATGTASLPKRASSPEPDVSPRPALTAEPSSPPAPGLPPAPVYKQASKRKPQPPPASNQARQPSPEPSVAQGLNLKAPQWTGPADYPVFAGHRVAPAAWQPAAWDQPIERQPEAPDYDALCPGPWAELQYRTQKDVQGSQTDTRDLVRGGTRNVRVYLHPLVDASGAAVAYTAKLKFDGTQCAEVVGVPSAGQKPKLTGGVVAGGVGMIVRGLSLTETGIQWKRRNDPYIEKGETLAFPRFAVLHDTDIVAVGHIMGVAKPDATLTYLEFRGNVIGNNTDWHLFYLERSIGQLVALSNVFYGSGRWGHAFKNLAHQSRIEGNVFSNVGIDGQPLATNRKGKDIVGMMPLDLYLCTETVFRNNTVIFRTSGSVRSFMAYRGRRAWGNCDKGKRLDNGRWELWPPESPEYSDPAKWAEIAAAVPAFEQGYEAAKAEPWLFTHKVEGNHFIAFNAIQRDGEPIDDTWAARVVSIRPVADNPIRAGLGAEAKALARQCAEEENRINCALSGMSPGLRYAYDHASPSIQDLIVNKGRLPRGVPIPAPEGWTERAGVFWGDNDFITCSADGSDCQKTGPRAVDASPRAWDSLEVANPPRVIME